jgi:hypothetical protein
MGLPFCVLGPVWRAGPLPRDAGPWRGVDVAGQKEEKVLEGVVLPPVRVRAKAPRPSGCGRYVMRELAAAMPQICQVLLDRVVEKSDVAAVRLLLQMASPAGPGVSAGGSGAGGLRQMGRRELGFAEKTLRALRESRAVDGES